MASKYVGLRGEVLKTKKLEGANIKEGTQLLVNSFTPMCSLRRGKCLLISTRDYNIAHVQSMSNQECAREPRNVRFADVGSTQVGGTKVKVRETKNVVDCLSGGGNGRDDV